jgi:endoglucanase
MNRSIRIILGMAVLALAGLAVGQNPDYKALHNLLIQYYGYQRAGDKTIDTHNPFYEPPKSPAPHSADAVSGQDLGSGWYDAGDFVKFGLNQGFSAYCLLKGYDVFPHGYDDITSWDYKGAPDNIPDILGEVKLSTDYLQRAVVSASQIVVDVGNAATDHQGLSEDGYTNSQRTSPRQVYTGAGADVAGLYAAALALMSKLYTKYDPTYATACLAKAKLAFQFGVAHPSLSTEQDNGSYYSTKTYKDKMACGAVELFRATGDSTYLTQAKTFLGGVVQHYYVLGYANVGDLAAFELKRLGVPNADAVWLSDVAFTMNRVVTASNASPLIKGAFINTDWGNPGNAGCAGFSAALAFMITGDTKYLTFARNQAHWVAGLSPFTQSYVVGFGNGTSINPHNRNDVARLNGVRMKGGVVAGPYPGGSFDATKPEASSWSFNPSDASNYKNVECAVNYNAGMVGLVGFLRDYDNPPADLVRIATPLSATPGNADLSTGHVTVSGALEKSAAWTITFRGTTSKAKKSVTGTGTAISVTWAGEADSGSFVVGESVEAKLDMANIAPYHLSRATTSFNISALKLDPFKATDIKLDDFEDGDTVNAVSGTWKIFSDKPTGTSSTNPATMPAAVLAGEGQAGGKGIGIRLISGAGATHPFVGVKTTFNASGAPVSIGPATNIVFDVSSTAGSSLWVELEQSDITDGAYYSKEIDFANASWNRLRIPIASLAQPSWKTAAKGLNLGSVTALRFTYYGASNVRFSLDNVYIENLKIGGVGIRSQSGKSNAPLSALRAGRDGLRYFFQPPVAVAGDWKAEVVDAFGRTLDTKNLGKVMTGVSVDFNGMRLSPGLYFLRHTAGGSSQEYVQRIYVRPEAK